MSAHDCCAVPREAGPPSRRLGRPTTEAASCFLSGILWALLPKCPACLAAWIAVGTGIGLSTLAASRIRMVLLGLCLVPFACLTVRSISRWRESAFTGLLVLPWKRTDSSLH